MADSIDRVFAHALQTVRKLPRTGSARPPTQDRLRLYGLYKQSMEGDVEGVMARPDTAADPSPETRAEAEKWEAWAGCAGLTRTQAKTAYIDTLITTMHSYASGTAESRGLVQELEFVWDQVRGNAAAGGLVEEERLERERGRRGRGRGDGGSRQGSSRSIGKGSGPRSRKTRTESGLRVMRPMSEADGEEGSLDEEDERDFEDEEDVSETEDGEESTQEDQPSTRNWQGRMENAVVRLTAEVAAVREQLDGANHSLWAMVRGGSVGGRNGRPWIRWILWRAWTLVRRLFADALFAAVLLACWRIWMRWKRGETDPKAGFKNEVGALQEGIEMVEAWVGFWWSRWREGVRRRFGGGRNGSS